jgi:hypothetical protein
MSYNLAEYEKEINICNFVYYYFAEAC